MKLLELTQGQYTKIDDDDYERVSKFKWSCTFLVNGPTAGRTDRSTGKIKHIYLHRFIMDVPDDMEIDHINHDTLDNRKSNLRICTRSENNQNRYKWGGTTSKYKGVTRRINKGGVKWIAQITLNKKTKHLGIYDDELEAHLAYKKYKAKNKLI